MSTDVVYSIFATYFMCSMFSIARRNFMDFDKCSSRQRDSTLKKQTTTTTTTATTAKTVRRISLISSSHEWQRVLLFRVLCIEKMLLEAARRHSGSLCSSCTWYSHYISSLFRLPLRIISGYTRLLHRIRRLPIIIKVVFLRPWSSASDKIMHIADHYVFASNFA